MTTTARLGLPLIEAAQAQKHVTHNEALALIDRLLQAAVADRDLAVPPAAPVDGRSWIVAAAPTGAWAGQAGKVATWSGGAWVFAAPTIGQLVWIEDEARIVVWSGSAWIDPVAAGIAAVTALQNLALLGIGTTADAANPLSAKLNAALMVARPVGEGGTGDLRWTMSKAAAGGTLSLLMQTAYSGRAEIGLAGNDDLTVKVSANGSTWTDALRVAAATGETAARVLRPDADNARSLGTAAFRWSQVYAATATVNTSDAREKLDVTAAPLGLDFLRRLRPVAFRWRIAEHEADPADPAGPLVPRAGRRRHLGLIAQEVRAALGSEDAALWVEDRDTGLQGLRYAEFVPVLIRAVQELDARLAAGLPAVSADPSLPPRA